MAASTLLTVLAILVALLTAIVYLLQIVELLEKRILRVIGWIKKRKHVRVDIHSTEPAAEARKDEQHDHAQENTVY